jgi:hypothetical protein
MTTYSSISRFNLARFYYVFINWFSLIFRFTKLTRDDGEYAHIMVTSKLHPGQWLTAESTTTRIRKFRDDMYILLCYQLSDFILTTERLRTSTPVHQRTARTAISDTLFWQQKKNGLTSGLTRGWRQSSVVRRQTHPTWRSDVRSDN